MKLSRNLNIIQGAARQLGHRLRAGFARPDGLFASPVEVDEVQVDGKEHAPGKLRAGRGTVGKQPVVGARVRAGSQVAARPVPNTTWDLIETRYATPGASASQGSSSP